MSSNQRSRRLAAARERLASRGLTSIGPSHPLRSSFDAQPTIPLADPVDQLFRGDTSIPAPPVEDIPSEVEISRWEAETRHALFSQRDEGAPMEASVPPPPPVGLDNLRESLDSLPPILAIAPTLQEAQSPARTSPSAEASPGLTDELDDSAPGTLRDELDTSRPPPMSVASGAVPAVLIAPEGLKAPPPGVGLDEDEGNVAREGAAPPHEPEATGVPASSADRPNFKSARTRMVVLSLGGLAVLALGVSAAIMVFTAETPAIVHEPAATAPRMAQPPTPAPKAPATKPEPTPTPPVTALVPKLMPPSNTAKPAPVATPPQATQPAPEPAAPPSRTSSIAVSATKTPPVPRRTPVAVDKPAARPRPAPVEPPRALAPEPVEPGAAKLSANEAAQTLANARRKLAEDDAEGAEELMRQLLQHEPRNDQALDVLARALIDQDRGAAAAAVAEKLVALRPRSVPYLLLLGDALLMKGDESGAKNAWRKALDLRPGDAGATQRLGL